MMYRIRLHGRGGQGVKTAGRIVGTAFFLEGFEVQDAPLYGAERRGAPIVAFVRAARGPIHERGVILRPDLVAVADDSLVAAPLAGVLPGLTERAVLLIHSAVDAAAWQALLRVPGRVVTLAASGDGSARAELRFLGARVAGAAARLAGVISRDALAQAIREELGPLGDGVVEENLARALGAYDAMAGHAGCVAPGEPASAAAYRRPAWIDLPLEAADLAAPVVLGAHTSALVKTGAWRTARPVIDPARCGRCSWICGTMCPDGVISAAEDGTPRIDLDHCKGCMICAAECPWHAIEAIPERAPGGAP
jgi:pyruvate ferredoxin oxidoreductase gamma subunit